MIKKIILEKKGDMSLTKMGARIEGMNFMGVIIEHVVDSYDIINGNY